jgi:dTDP-4-dehydrorhamnose reductase
LSQVINFELGISLLKKILVLGATGNLGSRLIAQAQLGRSVIGTSRSIQSPGIFKYEPDPNNTVKFIKLLEDLSPDVVINCIAMTSIDMCQENKTQSLEVNFTIPDRLSTLTNDFGAQFVQLSTDAVFDGRTKNVKYDEDDTRNPVNEYGKHKAMAEDSVLNSSPKNLILRTNFFGFGIPPRKTFLDEALIQFIHGNKTFGFTDSIATFLPVSVVADITLSLIDADAKGIFHLSASESVSKFDFLRDFQKELGIPGDLVIPALSTATLKTHRGLNLSLSSSKIEAFLGKKMPLPYFRTDDFEYSGIIELFDS